MTKAEHSQSDTSRSPNRLIRESSPYLRQHAHNPVNWLPWGPQAFEIARREDKPIFLSIGYATCHWCHVMARESFEDPATADLLNRFFVPVKVDREERPDVDETYMMYVQSTTGHGGWPLNVWLTPDGRPFLGGTYFPPTEQGGAPAFKTVVRRVADLWHERHDDILSAAEEIHLHLRAAADLSRRSSPPTSMEDNLSARAFDSLKALYDDQEGGFGDAPKFPQPAVLDFLFLQYYRTDNKGAVNMALHTLRAMARGGLYDHLGGGFHRYATDRQWRVPHFEKMLYDQALLACTYLDAFKISGDASFADVARGILAYVEQNLMSADGGCFSAEDADSPLPGNPAVLAEGAFYLWACDEVQRHLGPALAPLFMVVYGVERSGNVAHDASGHFRRQNILFLAHTAEQAAAHFRLPIEEVQKALHQARANLFAARRRRPPPAKDTKVLTSWNGLMISAFARAAMTLDSQPFLDRARQIAQHLRTRLWSPTGHILYHCLHGEQPPIPAFLSDYAFLVGGLLDLYEASLDPNVLDWAVVLQKEQDTRLWDPAAGGYFSAGNEDPFLPVRLKSAYDGAVPSDNAVAAMNLIRLGRLTDSTDHIERAERLLKAFGADLQAHPQAMVSMLCALDRLRHEPPLFTILGKPESPAAQALLRVVHERFMPDKLVMRTTPLPGSSGLHKAANATGSVEAEIHLCLHGICLPPCASPAALRALLNTSFTPPPLH